MCNAIMKNNKSDIFHNLTLDLLIGYVNKTLTNTDVLEAEAIFDEHLIFSEALEGALLMTDDVQPFEQTYINDMLRNIDDKVYQIQNRGNEHRNYITEAEQTYTLDELLNMFAVVEHYDAILTEVERSATAVDFTTFEVLAPLNGQDCSHSLQLVFSKAVAQDLEVWIENNQEEELLSALVPAGCTAFNIDTSSLSPGCYYWRIECNEEDFLLGKFYIRKDLMPNNNNML